VGESPEEEHNKMKTKLLTILLTLLLVITATGCTVTGLPEESQDTSASQEESISEETSQPDREEIPEQPLSTLGENVVYSSDYLYTYNLYASQYGPMLNQEMDGKTVQEHLVDYIMDMLKQTAVLYNAAVKEGMELSQEEKDGIHKDVQAVLEVQYQGDEQKFLNAFALTPAQMESMLGRSKLIDQYYSKALEAIEVTDEEIAEYYKNNQDSLDQVTVRHILIDCTDEMSEEEQNAAKAKAEDLLAQVQSGEDIGKLAAEHSSDPGSKDNNGEYTFGRGQMVAEFEDWAFSAKPGDKGMVKTTYGYHIMEKISQTGLEDVRPQIMQILRQQKFPEQYSEIDNQVNSSDWTLNQELLEQIHASVAL